MIQQFHFGYLSEESKKNSERYMHPYVYYTIIYNSQDMETILSAHWWKMDKEDDGAMGKIKSR